MRIKSYFEPSLQSAIAAARRELGSDAMLLNSRQVSEPGEDSRFEVVFGVDETLDEPVSIEPGPVTEALLAKALPAALAPRRPLSSSLGEIQRQVAELQAALAVAVASDETDPTAVVEWRERLREFDLGPELIERLLGAGRERIQGRGLINFNNLGAALRSEMDARLRYAELVPTGTRALALVGPPGGGKTITLVKIAIRDGLAAGRGVRLIAFDAYRPAASEQLRALALAMGVEFSREESLAGLVEAISRTEAGDLVLIDTPGFSFSERDEVSECARTLSCLENLSTHMVLPASMKRADLARYSNFYAAFNPDTLILTRLDETECVGAAVSVAMTSGLPVSALGQGPSVSKDLCSARDSAFLDRIFGLEQRVENVA